MASLKIYFDTRAPRKDGSCPLKVAINHKGSFLINLQVYMTPDEFTQQILIRDNSEIITYPPNRVVEIRYINSRVLQLKAAILNLKLSGKLSRLSNKELKNILENDIIGEEEEKKPLLFEDRYKAYTANISRQNTLLTYQYMHSKLEAYTNLNNLTFEDMTYSWIKDFDLYLQKGGLAPNTRSIYLRNIRTIFNDAIDRDLIPQNYYPFRRFKMPKEQTAKRSLTIDQIRQLRDYDCEEHQRQYRDIFMLIFYLGGINIIDLCYLKEIRNGYIEYRRAKTGRLYKIKVEPEALEIIERYKGKDYLINIMDRYTDYRDYRQRINRNLGEIGTTEIVKDKIGKLRKKKRTASFPDLTTYWARHTWATIAAELDIPKETIAATLGHGGHDVTDIYIAFDQRKIDKAIRQVIDYVNAG